MGNHWCVHLPDFLAEYGTIALEAQGYRRTLRQDPNRLSDLYDPGFIHADSDLTAIAAGLIESKAGRLRLYGPPGTGESAPCALARRPDGSPVSRQARIRFSVHVCR
jgi:hypothetical protein